MNRYVIIIALVIGTLFLLLIYKVERTYTYICSGDYMHEKKSDDDNFKSKMSISAHLSSKPIALMALEGIITDDTGETSVYRDMIYDVVKIDGRNDLHYVKLNNKLSSETAEADFADFYFRMFNFNGNGKTIRLWKLDNNTILLGSVFSPVVQCVKQ